MTGRLDHRVAVITGGGRGIGEAIAARFAAEGARLVLASRTASELERVAERCQSLGAECSVCVADVSNTKQARRPVEHALDQFDRIDVLVNAAGVYGPIGPIIEVDLDEWVRALEINLLGTLFACSAALPAMIARGGGKIINFSGGGATSPLPRFSAYGVSKAAVVRLTETLAEEVKPYGICVNAIAPGAVDTRLQDDVLAAGDRAGALHGQIRSLRESGAGGTPIDVPANLALFLASDESDGLTGRLISAPHDPWEKWDAATIKSLDGTPWYTLRRIDPFTVKPLKGLSP
jgi:3-oxoacyl-[acyl-carrier protein] reductase